MRMKFFLKRHIKIENLIIKLREIQYESKKIRLDLTKLEPVDNLTAEELVLHAALQQGKLEFHHDPQTLQHYAEIFKNSAKQRKAAKLGLPYQALINSLIHRYVNGETVF